MNRIVSDTIDVGELIAGVTVPQAGGIDLFLGTTRDQSKGRKVIRLEYEAYVPMAIKIMDEIEVEVRQRWPVCRFSSVHRIGVVPVTEASVAIAVSTPHRKEAFEACRYAIDELKKRVPIWKKEIFEDGEVWVENEEARIKRP
ncbi:MAG TPA: molybdenum cofactor biosynthesis protein MoaE [Bacteroidota bacterium]|nr:molybdenum cofactor biosynthesis protein MoaE [Bacteroidota bacterium]